MIFAPVPSILHENSKTLVAKSKVLVVGAGGIGCEILKNLALSGFSDIEIIDLDTIDVSNLNRQFLFRKEHVGKSKAEVAKESILSYNDSISITAYHDSITKQEYGVNFFKRFKLVLNALDNRAARNHVNRMCLAADIPLIESGTAGYSGQVEFIKKGKTQCYECQPKPPQKTYPGCTIRNTPSEPVHCIVWAKHLFNQLFGEDDPDQDVSPDVADPEAKIDGELNSINTETESGNVQRKSTHYWAQEIDYDPGKLFNKFFKEDIEYLLTMKNLWVTRKAPKPIDWSDVLKDDTLETKHPYSDEMQVWSLKKCGEIFAKSIDILKQELAGKEFLVWDKDDKVALDFVAACANIRSKIFAIELKSRFEVKSIAGNIIPAIATANAIIAGLVVLIAFRVLAEEYDKCQSVYLRPKSVHSNTILAAENNLEEANPNCYVCSPQPFVSAHVNVDVMTVKEFENDVLKNNLNMIAPDVLIDGKGVFIISSEEGETEMNNDKKLSELGIIDGTILKADDFVQSYNLTIGINNYVPEGKEDPPFKIEANPSDLKATREDKEEGVKQNGSDTKVEQMEIDKAAPSSPNDVRILEDDDPQEGTSSKKRKLNPPEEDDDLEILDDPDVVV